MILNFQLSLPPQISLLRDYAITPETEWSKRQSIQILITTHSIVACAQLKVHRLMKSCGLPCTSPSSTPLDIALGILQSHYTLCASGCTHFDPVVGTLCELAYRFLLDEQVAIERRDVGIYWFERDLGVQIAPHGHGGQPPPTEEEAKILVAVEESKSIMTFLSTACPCISEYFWSFFSFFLTDIVLLDYEFEKTSKEYDARLPKTIGFRS